VTSLLLIAMSVDDVVPLADSSTADVTTDVVDDDDDNDTVEECCTMLDVSDDSDV